ncbi:hypothetical protein, partial [Arthrobacter sp. H14]|uniref:hypothetical protein n=1 Tax=Arthrobacter sp. H14 TaxID=1312959 RepID=UPI000688CBF5
MKQNSRIRIFLTAAVLSIPLLSGCSPAPDYDPATAARLQGGVLTVTELAADGDYAQALKALEKLSASVDSAATNGAIGSDRTKRIEKAITTVQRELETKTAEQKQPRTKPEPKPEPPAPAPAPAPAPDPQPPAPAPNPPAPAPAVPAPTGTTTPPGPEPEPTEPAPPLPEPSGST